MAFNFNRRINPVIPTTAVQVRNNAELVLVTRGFTGDLVTPKFVIQLDQAIPYGNTMPVVMSDVDGNAAVMYDRYGNYVRADRLYRAMKMRQAGCLPYNGCNPAEFQCVVGFDPIRITILSDLPLSVYCPSVTTTINRVTTRSSDGTTTATVQTTTHEME